MNDGDLGIRSAGARLAAGVAVLLVGIASSPGAFAAPGGPNLAQSGPDDFDPGYPRAALGGGWQEQRLYGYQGRAGLYNCAQGRVDTTLARTACGGNKFPNRFF